MLPAAKTFVDRTARDLMSRDVITIPRRMSLRAAAHRLAEAGVSGAPVTDESGRCVGVLSKTDLIRFLDRGPQSCHDREPDVMCSDWQMCDLQCLPAEDVEQYMTARVITADPDTPAVELARRMHRERIHRVLITDDLQRVIGVVSSMDILAAIAGEDAMPRCD
jgi:CBS domain-containing protein